MRWASQRCCCNSSPLQNVMEKNGAMRKCVHQALEKCTLSSANSLSDWEVQKTTTSEGDEEKRMGTYELSIKWAPWPVRRKKCLQLTKEHPKLMLFEGPVMLIFSGQIFKFVSGWGSFFFYTFHSWQRGTEQSTGRLCWRSFRYQCSRFLCATKNKCGHRWPSFNLAQ